MTIEKLFELFSNCSGAIINDEITLPVVNDYAEESLIEFEFADKYYQISKDDISLIEVYFDNIELHIKNESQTFTIEFLRKIELEKYQ